MQEWTVPQDSIINSIDVYSTLVLVHWLRFTTTKGDTWEIGYKPITIQPVTIIFSKESPFLGVKTFSDTISIYAIAFLSLSPDSHCKENNE